MSASVGCNFHCTRTLLPTNHCLARMSSSLVSAMRGASGLVSRATKQQARKARDLHTSRAALGSLQIPDRLQHVVDAQV